MISDGPIEGFKGGWAKIPFRGRLGHYWQSQQEVLRAVGEPEITKRGRIRLWMSLCGMWGKTDRHIPAIGVGEFPYCKRCALKVAR